MAGFKNIFRIRLALHILQSPKVAIDLYGGDVPHEFYAYFTKPHPSFPLVSRNTFGAALVDLTENGANYLADKKYARRRYNKSKKLGHEFRQFDATQHIDELIGINTSTDFRQNRRMIESYSDKEKVRNMARVEAPSFGVFSEDGKLLAYTHAPILGDVFSYSRILGHSDHLESGVMFRLVVDTNDWMRQHYQEHGFPRWAYYDMFLGASPGLRFFKQNAGFRPYRVSWRWRQED